MKHSRPPLATRLQGKLAELEGAGLLREPHDAVPSERPSFCSNDYLGFAAAPLEAGAVAAGLGAARLVRGDVAAYRALESSLATWVGLERALAFSSGYAANVGALSALVSRDDLVVSDALNHASIIDGIRLARAQVAVVPHLDLEAIAQALADRRQANAWVVTESYFSMDADGPDVAALAEVCAKGNASLYVDDAHALGVFGPGGAGRCAEARVEADALMGTFGKAIGTSGAFVAGREAVRTWLWNRARSFVFSTGMSPALAEGTRARIDLVKRSDAARTNLLARAAQLRGALAERGCDVRGFGPIIPWVIGDDRKAVEVARQLVLRGVLVRAIRPPTVPIGTARIRLTVTAAHSASHIEDAIGAIDEVLKWQDG